MNIKKEDKEKLIQNIKVDLDLKEHFEHFPETKTSWYIERFLKSRDYNYEKSKLKLKNCLIWRKKKNLDRIFKINFEETQMKEILGRGKYNTDKEGRPIVINRIADFQVEKFLKNFKYEELEDYHLKKYEQLLYILFPICSKIKKKKIDKVLVIMDLKGVNLKKIFNSQLRKTLKKISKTVSDNCPEILGKCYILNAPFYFRFIWKVVKFWVDKKTRNNFVIFSNNGEKELKKIIDEDNLPVFLGGNCDKKIYEEPGPWKEFVKKADMKKERFLEELRHIEYEFFYTEQEKMEIFKIKEKK